MGVFERLPGWLDRFAVPRTGMIVVGAHAGQELEHYLRAGFARQVWVEPQAGPFAALTARLARAGERVRARAFNVACGESEGVATMYTIENNEGLSNSLLKPKLHLSEYPEMPAGKPIEVPVVRLDGLLAREGLRVEDYSFLVMDVQGFELSVLKGCPDLLSRGVRAILTEVSVAELYEGCVMMPEMDGFLKRAGFVRVITRLNRHRYGDALYVRAAGLSVWQRLRLRVLGAGRR